MIESGLKRNPEARKARILAAAADVFARDGYGGGRVDSIAELAGVNKRMLYHYFGDKAGLFDAVIAQQLPVLRAFCRGAFCRGACSRSESAAVRVSAGGIAAEDIPPAAAVPPAAVPAPPTQLQLQILWRLLAWDAVRRSPAVSAEGLRASLDQVAGTAGQRQAGLLRLAYSVLQSLLPEVAVQLGGTEDALDEQLKTLETPSKAAKPRVKLAPSITPSGTASSRE